MHEMAESAHQAGGEVGLRPRSPVQAHYDSGLDIAPSSLAVLVISISTLSALDHLLGTSCETLIGFEVRFESVHQRFMGAQDEAEVENPDCVHRPEGKVYALLPPSFPDLVLQ